MTTIDRVRQIVDPLLTDRGLQLYDVEQHGPVVRVTVTRAGGIDLQDLSDVTRAVSLALDEHDPVPGRYTLEVSSPGLERPLRTPDHFRGAIGDHVSLKTVAGTEGDRRVTGELVEADDDGIVVRPEVDGERRLSYQQIERARTVFEWGPGPRPTSSKSPSSKTPASTTTKKKKAAAS